MLLCKRLLLLLLLCVGTHQATAQTSITAGIPYDGQQASGEYLICRSQIQNVSVSQIRKPIIFVEAFDASNDWNLGDLRAMLYNGGLSSIGSTLNNLGYDIVILNFDDGGDYIQKNAFLLVQLIQEINSQKPNPDPLVVIGYSMGGLVARYALAYMEGNSLPHDTRLYVSFDSPHKGANIPVSVQALALTFSSPTYQAMFPDLEASLKQFTAPAAQQMLRYRLSSATQSTGVVPLNSTYVNFMTEMNALNSCYGFPVQSRNVAISLGSWNGSPQRSNQDIDGDGHRDFQFGGVPVVFLNFPRSSGSGSSIAPIWALNTCEMVATFLFQAWMSTCATLNYPYVSDRQTFTGMTNPNEVWATYWYNNSVNPVLPLNGWSRGWQYGNNSEPTDFAPGSYSPVYQLITDALNSQIECSFNIYDDATFVPTVSALCFDTDDLFYNIGADPDRLSKTPFDAIFGVNSDVNRSHVASPVQYSDVNLWLLNELNNDFGKSCRRNFRSLQGSVGSGSNVLSNDATRVMVTNYTVNSGATVRIVAPESIELMATEAANGSLFVVETGSCGPKTCGWTPQFPYRKAGLQQPLTYIGLDTPVLNPVLAQEGSVTVMPNPSNGMFDVRITWAEADYSLCNSLGGLLLSGYLVQGNNPLRLQAVPGIYLLRVVNRADGAVRTLKVMIR